MARGSAYVCAEYRRCLWDVSKHPGFFTVTSILIGLGALWFYASAAPRPALDQICIGLIVGGAIGNIIDRIRYRYVVDFVHVSWFPGIFNLADSAITVGVVMLAAYLLIFGESSNGVAPPGPDEALLGDLPLSRDQWQQRGDRQ